MHGPDLTNADLDADELPYGVDFRSIYKCVLRDHLLSSDLARTFPEAQPIDDVLTLVG